MLVKASGRHHARKLGDKSDHTAQHQPAAGVSVYMVRVRGFHHFYVCVCVISYRTCFTRDTCIEGLKSIAASRLLDVSYLSVMCVFNLCSLKTAT